MPDSQPPSNHSVSPAPNVDLAWVWREVRKRAFIKMPFSLPVADAMEAVIPIVLDGDHFVVGLSTRDFPMSGSINQGPAHNTIETILQQAAGKSIRFEVIEGTTLADWEAVVARRGRAQDAVIAMASKKAEDHHFDDILNQIVGEIRHRASALPDRMLPQVRAGLILDIAPSLSDAADMLFTDPDSREAKRAMARVIERISGFLEIPPMTLSLEIERYYRSQRAAKKAAPLIGPDMLPHNAELPTLIPADPLLPTVTQPPAASALGRPHQVPTTQMAFTPGTESEPDPHLLPTAAQPVTSATAPPAHGSNAQV